MLKYNAKVMGCLCSLETFEINGIKAAEDDFVNNYDHSPETAEDSGCGNMKADVKPATSKILNKYGITLDEYNTIADDIAEKLSFGECGMCV